MSNLDLTLEWGGGSEALFGNVKKREISMQVSDLEAPNIRGLLKWLRESSGLLTDRPDLFFAGNSVRPGILVLVNDADWELCHELDYVLKSGDRISFLSTLHGG